MVTINDFQHNTNRRPLVELISSSFVQDIPFDGKLLTTETQDETHSTSITHSSGRILMAYAQVEAVGNQEIHYKFSDIDRQEFSEVVWSISSSTRTVEGISITELNNGDIGIVWLENDNDTTYYLQRKTMTVLGVELTTGLIGSWAFSIDTGAPSVLQLT